MDLDAKIAAAAYYKAHGVSNAGISVLLRADLSSVSRYLKHAEDCAWLAHKLDLHLPKELERKVLASARNVELEDKLFDFFAGPGRVAATQIRRPGLVVVRGRLVGPGRTENGSRKMVPEASSSDDLSVAMLSIEGARLLVDILSQRERGQSVVLGVTWGRQTGGVVSYLENIILPELPEVQVVALQGGVGRGLPPERGGQNYPDVLAERIATLFRCRQAPARITLPAFVPSRLARELGDEGLKAIWKFIDSDQSFQTAASLHKQLDVGLVGVGAFEPGAWAVTSGYLSTADMKDLRRAGAVGDIVCRFFREAEEPLIEGWVAVSGGGDAIRAANLRAVGISLATLQARVRTGARVLAVAGGAAGAKALALRAAVRAGLVSDVVTDEVTCLALIATGRKGFSR